MFQWSSRNRHQSVDRDGINSKLSKAHCHIQTVFPGFAHADDTAGAGTHAFSLDFFESFNLHVVSMGSADVRKISAGGFDIVVIAGHACLVKTMKLFSRKKSHGSAEIDLTFSVHGFIGMDRLIKFFSCQSFSGGDDGKTVNTFRLIHLTGFENFFFRKKIVNFTGSVVVCRLCTVFTVFRTSAAASVDDRAEIYSVSDTCCTDTVSTFA